MSSQALALCNTIDLMSVSPQVQMALLLNAEKFSEVVFGTREPSMFDAMLDAIESSLSAARKAGGSLRGSGVAHAAAIVGNGMSNVWQRFNAAMASRAQMSPA
jgi:hypothetical protein